MIYALESLGVTERPRYYSREYEARRGIGGWIEEEEEEPMETHWDVGTQTEEEEPEETHWDKGTQTEDDVKDQYLPLKKRPLRIEEESP